jgi:hypothetical protein
MIDKLAVCERCLISWQLMKGGRRLFERRLEKNDCLAGSWWKMVG